MDAGAPEPTDDADLDLELSERRLTNAQFTVDAVLFLLVVVLAISFYASIDNMRELRGQLVPGDTEWFDYLRVGIGENGSLLITASIVFGLRCAITVVRAVLEVLDI